MGRSLADRYGINVSVESPKWSFPFDTEDVAIADPQSAPNTTTFTIGS